MSSERYSRSQGLDMVLITSPMREKTESQELLKGRSRNEIQQLHKAELELIFLLLPQSSPIPSHKLHQLLIQQGDGKLLRQTKEQQSSLLDTLKQKWIKTWAEKQVRSVQMTLTAGRIDLWTVCSFTGMSFKITQQNQVQTLEGCSQYCHVLCNFYTEISTQLESCSLPYNIPMSKSWISYSSISTHHNTPLLKT